MKKDLSKIKDLKATLESLKKLSWDDLSYEIMKLTVEFDKIKRFLKSSEVQLYQDFINLYEIEKSFRFDKKVDYTPYMNGPRPMIVEWLEIEIDEWEGVVPKKKDSDEDFE